MMRKPEGAKKHYFSGYDTPERFSSYLYQIDTIRSLKPGKVLEVGVGNKTVSNYLRETGLSVVTCDNDAGLGADIVADVRALPFPDGFCDVASACEVLEHMPFEDFGRALSELRRVSGRYVVVSLPYHALSIELALSAGIYFFKRRAGVLLRLPRVFTKPFFRSPAPGSVPSTPDGHYWEIGWDGYPLEKVRGVMSGMFRIVREGSPPGNAKHYFFILEKK
jgi:hypothetical protein